MTDTDQQPTILAADTVTLDLRLDRLPSFDYRSRRYPTRALLGDVEGTDTPPPRSYTWQVGPVLDQGNEGACVGFGHAARIMAAPDRHPEVDNAFAREVYKAAQLVDEWDDTPPEEGSSVLAGAKILASRGLYTSYHWDFKIEDQILSTGWLGPNVVGTYWLESMFYPRPSGLLEVHGQIAGGHCYLRRGVRLKAILPGEGPKPLEVFRYRNSWDYGFGVKGDFYMLIEDAARLHSMDGDSMTPFEPGQHRTEI